MRQAFLLVLLVLTVPAPARAQAQVGLEVTASEPVDARGARRPQVRTPDILRDRRWLESLQNSFPLRLNFRVEVWRVRTDWFDALERAFEWETVIQYEPLADQYAKTVLYAGVPRSIQRFSTLQELERDLERVNQVNIAPAGSGEYYFTADLQIRTLSDEEVEELERFLQGQPADENPDRPGSVARTAKRLLLQFGGLPYDDLEARSRRFRVRP
jgi:hypothetical protein